MEPRGSSAEPFSSPYDILPAARVQCWASIAARLGAVTEIPTQENVAA